MNCVMTFYATFMIANLQFRDIWILKSLSCCLYEKQYGADLFDIFFIIIVIPALILYIYIVAFSDSWQLPKYIFNTFLNVYIVLFLFFAESFLICFDRMISECKFRIKKERSVVLQPSPSMFSASQLRKATLVFCICRFL